MIMVLGMVWKILFIVFFFGFCIFIHEFGHLLAALWMGLHVEKFSIGFGKKIWGFKRKGVEYVVSILPFGGYVSLPQLDPVDNPKASDGTELKSSSPMARLVTAFAGPFFNVLFGFFLATIMFFVGLKEAPPAESCVVTAVPAMLPVYGDGIDVTDEIIAVDGVKTDKFLEEICGKMDPEKAPEELQVTIKKGDGEETQALKIKPNPEWTAGLRAGDRIIKVNGRSFTKGREELNSEYVYNDAPEVSLTFIRSGKTQDISYTPERNPLYEGLAVPFFAAANPIAIFDIRKGSDAEKAGLQPGDQILQIDDLNVTGAQQFASEFALRAGEKITLTVARKGQNIPIPFDTGKETSISDFGIFFSVIVSGCLDGYPAQKAGIKFGDRIIAVDGREVTDAATLTEILRESKGMPLELRILRNGKEIIIKDLKAEEHDLNGKKTWIIGVTLSDGVSKIIAHPSPWAQFSRIVSQTGRTLSLLFSPITSRISGREGSSSGVKVEHMSGPLGIVLMLWYSLKNDGLRGGMALIILITFSLAIMNLLPIPVLDGGHMLFALIEMIIRRRLPPRFLNILQNVFAFLLIGMILYITFFDGRRVFRLAKARGSAQNKQQVQVRQTQDAAGKNIEQKQPEIDK